MSKIDISAIVLAAGANTRLGGLVPPYLKPLILVNGKPLLHHAVNHATQDWGAQQVIIVVSPDNAKAICSVEDPGRQYILQPQPNGVVDAIRRAIGLVSTEWVVILMADNTFEALDRSFLIPPFQDPMIGVRDDLSPAEMRRFTRYRARPCDINAWVKGIDLIEASDNESGQGVWIGPLLLRAPMVRASLLREPTSVTELIHWATNNGDDLAAVQMRCADLGVPEAL